MLQPGEIATPFIQRDYAEELDICKFYFEKFDYTNTNYQHAITGGFRDNNTFHGIFNFGFKRGVPSISSSAAATWQVREHDGTNTVAAAIAFDTIGQTTCRADLTTTGTPGTAGQIAWAIRDTSDDTYILVNSEI